MTAHLVRGDARRLPLASGSVQCVVTSPPYFGLRSYGGQTSIWGGDPECSHTLEDGPSLKPMTGGTGAASKKQVTNAGSQFGNAWAEQASPTVGRNDGGRDIGGRGGNYQEDGPRRIHGAPTATCTRCLAWRGELGSETNVAMFITHLVEVFREVKRVLRDDGCAFVNIGDGYYGSGKGPGNQVNGKETQSVRQGFVGSNAGSKPISGTRPKSLLLVPERLAIALSDDRWIVRSRIAWCKAAPMPESVRDRPTSAWEHIWMLTKSAKYYWDADAVRQPSADKQERILSPDAGGSWGTGANTGRLEDWRSKEYGCPATGANLRNFWLLSPDPYSGAHYATFPKELVKRCVASASSEYGACAACGAAWKRTTERKAIDYGMGMADTSGHKAPAVNGDATVAMRAPWGHTLSKTTSTTTGWAPTCKCSSAKPHASEQCGCGRCDGVMCTCPPCYPPMPVRPQIVLDPFSGSGTTAFVAASLGRVGVGVELSAEYTQQARYGRLAQDFLPFASPLPAQDALPLESPPPARTRDLFDEVTA